MYTVSKWKLYSQATSRRTHLHVNDPPWAFGFECPIRSFSPNHSVMALWRLLHIWMMFVVSAHVNDAITPVRCEVNQEALNSNSWNTLMMCGRMSTLYYLEWRRRDSGQAVWQIEDNACIWGFISSIDQTLFVSCRLVQLKMLHNWLMSLFPKSAWIFSSSSLNYSRGEQWRYHTMLKTVRRENLDVPPN